VELCLRFPHSSYVRGVELKYRGKFTCYKASSLNNSGLLWDRKVGSGMKRFVG